MNNKALSFLVLFLSLLGCYKEPAFLRDPRLEKTRREQGLEQLDGKFFLYRVLQRHDDQRGGAVVKRADYKRHHSENFLKSIFFYPEDSNSLYFLTTNSTSCSGKRITMMEAESILKKWRFR